MKLLLSVIICTHNPRKDFILRCIKALKTQKLDSALWELILIDNASDTSVSDIVDLSWHPKSRFILERHLGLSHARARAVQEAKSEILVFVDDDNVLSDDYLSRVLDIMSCFKKIGAIGGSCEGDFEIALPRWMYGYEWMVGVRVVTTSIWCNWEYSPATPIGAGMAIRIEVAKEYVRKAKLNLGRIDLGRKGSSLMSCEDIDMAYCSFDLGYGIGVFSELTLTHLIPSQRLQIGYISRLARAMVTSGLLLDYYRGNIRRIRHPLLRFCKLLCKIIFCNKYERSLSISRWRGANDAGRIIKSMLTS